MPLRVFAAVLLVLAGAAAGLALHVAASKGDTVFSWKRPENLGLNQGRLASCRRTSNCVSSQAEPSDAVHFAAPIPFKGAATTASTATA
jgi:uncharacterized protein (DUF1499 family)